MGKTQKRVKATAFTTYEKMRLLKWIKATLTIAMVHFRREQLVRRFNSRNTKNYIQMYAANATLRDPDLSRITRTQDLVEYFAMLFEYANGQGFPPIQLTSKRMLVKGKFIYDIGEYHWSTLRRGKYVHKWAFIKDDFYLMSDRFTVE